MKILTVMVCFGGALKWDIKSTSKRSSLVGKPQGHKCVGSLEYVKSKKVKDSLQFASHEKGQNIF